MKAKPCKLVAKSRKAVKAALARVLVRPERRGKEGKRQRIIPGIIRFADGTLFPARIYRPDRRYRIGREDHLCLIRIDEATDELTGEKTCLNLHGCNCPEDTRGDGKRCPHVLAFRQLRENGEL